VRGLVDKLLADLHPSAEARQTRLINNCEDLLVQADPSRLEQVLVNLLANAIKYGREQGTVTVRARMVNGQVEVAVQDDGPGIAADSLDRVFERFYRVDKSRSREQGGTGLGLAIVKHIILSHGGRVWVESQLGKGATFFFTLPAAAAQTGASPLEPSESVKS
jgi:signal transduction histidine kinase